jgi:hypothetical protein
VLEPLKPEQGVLARGVRPGVRQKPYRAVPSLLRRSRLPPKLPCLGELSIGPGKLDPPEERGFAQESIPEARGHAGIAAGTCSRSRALMGIRSRQSRGMGSVTQDKALARPHEQRCNAHAFGGLCTEVIPGALAAPSPCARPLRPANCVGPSNPVTVSFGSNDEPARRGERDRPAGKGA